MHAPVPFHSHVARPSTAEAQVAALVATGSITPANMWVTCGAQAFNSDVVFQAQAGIKAKADKKAAAKEADDGCCSRSEGGGWPSDPTELNWGSSSAPRMLAGEANGGGTSGDDPVATAAVCRMCTCGDGGATCMSPA